MTRRKMLAGSAVWLAQSAIADTKQLRDMGCAPAGVPMRFRMRSGPDRSFDFIDHCHNLGFGVVETRLASTDAETIKKFRQKIDGYNMRAILDAPLPRSGNDVANYDAAVKAAKEAGAVS